MEKALQLVRNDLAGVEAQFEKNLSSGVPLIRKVGEYVLSSGGKRIRPLLLLLSARLAGYSGKEHVGLASVVEFIHTATLLHDDVVDSAVLRRGNASANSVWGNQASVLVGDFLFARSFRLMVDVGNLRILETLSDATTLMAEGEVLQLVSTCNLDLDEDCYMEVIRNKTAVLIAAACRCGAILGGIPPEMENALNDFGMDLGIAFQFMDDALDYVADQSEFGKETGHDLEEGKVTLPLIHTLRHCTKEEKDRISEIVEKEIMETDDRTYVTELICRHGGIDYTRSRAADMVERAKGRLSAFNDCAAKEALFQVADYVVKRRK